MAKKQTVKKAPTKKELVKIVKKYQAIKRRWRQPIMFAFGRRVRTKNGTVASVRFPVINAPTKNLMMAAITLKVLNLKVPLRGVVTVGLAWQEVCEILYHFKRYEKDGKRHKNLELLRAFLDSGDTKDVVVTFIFDDVDPEGVEDSTLKLYALSNGIFKPNELNLKKIFTKIPNVTWVGDMPMDVENVNEALMLAASNNVAFAADRVDKFPLFVDRIECASRNIRIADRYKVRLGAYIGDGTTVMPGASFINYNAGTEGPAMVEGRISQGVFVGSNSDLGGGASTIGTLSGGGTTIISIGRNCLLGANSSLGISIGDAVIIAADVAVLEHSKVCVNVQGHPNFGEVVKAKTLSGINAVTFWRHDETGRLELSRLKVNEEYARKLEDGESILNADLHKS